MAITLEEAKVGMADHVDQMVVDEFRRSSLLLDRLVFDNSISPGTGGSTLTYGYQQLKTPSTAAVRKINAKYTPSEAKRVKKTADAIIMGGAYDLDRVVINTSGAINELNFQTQQKIKATANLFHYLVINGQASTGGEGFYDETFDGLRKLLEGSSTGNIKSDVDISTSAMMDKNSQAFIDELDYLVSSIDGTPSMLLMNKTMLGRVRSCARRAGYYERTTDGFGRMVESYAGIPMMDAGMYYDPKQSKSIDTIATSKATSGAYGMTSIYAVSIGLDGFHGISPTGNSIIKSYLPDLNAPGPVKEGDVELIAGVVLKNTLKAAALNNIKIAPKTAA